MTNLSANIAGDGNTHQFSVTTPIPIGNNVAQLSASTGNTSPVYIGGSEVTSSVGFPIEPGGALLVPSTVSYNQLEYNIASGDSLSVLFLFSNGGN